jgi:Mce-associated membrane protein
MTEHTATVNIDPDHDDHAVAPDGDMQAARGGDSTEARDAVARARRAAGRTVSVRTIAVSVLAAAVVAALALLGVQLHSKTGQLDDLRAAAAGDAHAEKVALDYATAAADMDFHDMAGWRSRLTNNTDAQLSNRLTQAAMSMEQIVEPLQWVSTATPIVAKVRSNSGGLYSVDCFVSVLTKNSQAPDGIQSTATYQLTVDSQHNWVITDVSGIDSAVTSAGGSR